MAKTLIAISGTPGCGKSTLAKVLSRKTKLIRFDVHDYYKEISHGYDRSKRCYDIDLRKFEKKVREKLKESEQGIIVDSHISHLLPKSLVTLCIVLRCSKLKMLHARLSKRGYSKKKVRENLDAEIFQICLEQAREKKHTIFEFDNLTRATMPNLVNEVRALLRKGKRNSLKK